MAGLFAVKNSRKVDVNGPSQREITGKMYIPRN
jgi:hypothetical protein